MTRASPDGAISQLSGTSVSRCNIPSTSVSVQCSVSCGRAFQPLLHSATYHFCNVAPQQPRNVPQRPRTFRRRNPEKGEYDLLEFRTAVVPGLSAVLQPQTGGQSAYKLGELVGKKTDQVRVDGSGMLTSDDTATFDKLNQAVNSCQGLLQDFPSFFTSVDVLRNRRITSNSLRMLVRRVGIEPTTYGLRVHCSAN